MVVRKMKEKCKDAARMRREKERAEFVELSKLLPLPSSTTNQLDKASIIRLTSAYLRMRSAFPRGLGESWGEQRAQLRQAAGRLFSQVYQAQQSGFNNCAPTDAGQASSAHQQHGGAAQPMQQQQQQQQIRELGSLLLQTLDGFVFALHMDGKIMYISETASVHLGLPQIDLSGSSIFEYTHQADHNDLSDILSLSEVERRHLDTMIKHHSAAQDCHFELGRSFCMRMKCILPKRNAGLVSNGYKAIHCSGYLKVRRCQRTKQSASNCAAVGGVASAAAAAAVGPTLFAASANHHRPSVAMSNKQRTNCEQSQMNDNDEYDWECCALVAVGHSLLPSASTEVKLNNNSFMFRANLDLKLYYVESQIIRLLGYQQADLVGQSLYQFVHLADVKHLEEAHRVLLRKGQAVSKYFRIMCPSGGHIWIQMQTTLVNNPRSMPKPQHVVSICTIISEELNINHNHVEQSLCLIEQTCSTTIKEIQKIGGRVDSEHRALLDNSAPGEGKRKKKSLTTKHCSQKVDKPHHCNNKRRVSTLRKIESNKIASASVTKANLKREAQNDDLLRQHSTSASNQFYAHLMPTNTTNMNGLTSLPTAIAQGCIGNDNSFNNIMGQPITKAPHVAVVTNLYHHHTIGSSRRASDDSCSIVSSATSTHSVSSSSSAVNNNFESQLLYYDNQSVNVANVENDLIAKARSNYETDGTATLSESIQSGTLNGCNFCPSAVTWPTQTGQSTLPRYDNYTNQMSGNAEHYLPNTISHHHPHHDQYYQAVDENPIIYQTTDFTTGELDSALDHNNSQHYQQIYQHSIVNHDNQLATQYYQHPVCTTDIISL